MGSRFMRILVAEDDDVAAFLLQCELNKLDEHYSIQRAETVENYQRMLHDFSPTLVIASSKLISPSLIAETRQRAPGARLIVIGTGANVSLSRQALDYGATDCLFTSQLSELRLCLKQSPATFTFKTPQKPVPTGWRAKLDRINLWGDHTIQRLRKSQALQKLAPAWARFEQECKLQSARLAAWGKAFSLLAMAKAAHWFHFPRGLGALTVAPISSANPGLMGSGRFFAPEPIDLSPPGSETTLPDSFGIEDNLARFQVQTLARELTQEMASREEAESALESIDQSFRTLFESSLDAILLLDDEGTILQANSAACVLLSCPITELTRHRLLDFIEVSKHTSFQSEWKGMLGHGFLRSDKSLLLSDGRRREVQCSAKANVWCGVHLFIARDMTEPRKMSEELTNLRCALNKSLEAQAVQRRMLNDLEQRLSWFASSASKIARPIPPAPSPRAAV